MEFCSDPLHSAFRLGSLVFLFELVYNFRESLTDSAIALILTTAYSSIPSYYETKNFNLIFASLEIIGNLFTRTYVPPTPKTIHANINA